MVTTESSPVKRRRTDGQWRMAWREYTQNSTIQGLDKLTEDTPFTLRKYIWCLIVIGCIVSFIIQTSFSFSYFLKRPVAVNIKINHNKTLQFPAVTICNQNAFRTTRAAELGWYDMISDLFAGDEYSLSTDLEEYNAQNVSVADLYTEAGHDVRDLVLSCEWKGQRCGPEDFNQTITDHGLCYTFNGLGRHQNHSVLETHKTGSRGGLRLRLNIEQYEYMPGPNSGAGVKVQVHHQQDVPQIRDLGVSVPPGSHSMLGVTTVELHDLAEPYGRCDPDIKPRYYPFYTVASCQIERLLRHLVDTCGCKDIFMPDIQEGYPPVCNLTSYLECLLPQEAEFEMSEASETECGPGDDCYCPISCHRTLFSSTVSYGALSNFDTENFLRSGNLDEIKIKFKRARETVQRVDRRIVASDTKSVSKLTRLSKTLNNTFDSIQVSLLTLKAVLAQDLAQLKGRIQFHCDRGLTSVKYVIEHDFLRGWEVMEERAINHVTTGFYEMLDALKETFESLNKAGLSAGERTVLYLIKDQDLAARQTQAERALANITQTHLAYISGDPLLKFQLTYNRRYDMSYIHLPLFTSNMKIHMKYFNMLNESTNNLIDSLQDLRNVLKLIFLNQTDSMAEQSLLSDAEFKFIKACKRYNYRRFMFKSNVLLKPKELIEKRITKFEKLNDTLLRASHELEHIVDTIYSEISKVKKAGWRSVQAKVFLAQEYLRNTKSSKTQLAQKFISAETDKAFKDLELFFVALRSRSREFVDSLSRLKENILEIWENMLSEPSTKNFYSMVAADVNDMVLRADRRTRYLKIFGYMLRVPWRSLRNYSAHDFYAKVNGDFNSTTVDQQEAHYTEAFDKIRRQSTVASALGQTDQDFLDSFKDFRETLQVYLHGNKVNFEFIRNNFLNLDVYMKELYYEEMHQEIAYSTTNLLSDLGGNIGLWVGATVLTIFELLDFLLHNTLKIHVIGKRHKPSRDQSEYQSNGKTTL